MIDQKNTTLRLINKAKPYQKLFYMSLLTMFLSGFAGILPSWFVKVSIDGLAAVENKQSLFNVLPTQLLNYLYSDNNFFERILNVSFNPSKTGYLYVDLSVFEWDPAKLYIILPLAIIGVFMLEAFFKFLYQYNSRELGLQITRSLRDDFHNHINRISISQQRNFDSGSIVSVVSSDLQSLQSWLAETMMNLFSESFTAFFLFFWLLLLNWKLTIISVIAIPLFAIPVLKLGKGIRKYSKKGQDFVGSISSFVNETIKNQTIIKAFNLENWRQERFVEESKSLHALFNKWAFYMALVSPATNLIAAIGIATILFFGLSLIKSGELSVGEFSSFFVTSILLYDPVKRLGRVSTIFQSALGVADRVFGILDEPIQEESTARNYIYDKKFSGAFEFKNVSFAYAPGKNVLENLSLKVEPKTSIAIVGPSGSGKSTLVSLMPRFYDINAGEILFDGVNTKEMSLKQLRRQIAIVTQEPLLFTGTIKENILLGAALYHENKHAKELEEKLLQAAKDSYVLEFAENLQDGLDHYIGEQGSRLSIGQKQRISLARAFISEAPIIILDEPTSALDNESQDFIYKSIVKLMETRTVIIIAHRLSTIRNCDKIVFLENGKIIEEGSHDELISKSGAYSTLLNH